MKGFTLIELVITLAIFAILVVIAYPSYTKYIVSARRSDAQSALLDLAARMEQYYAENNSYAGATIGVNPATDIVNTAASAEGWYNLTVNSNASSYTLTATPIGAQASQDSKCTSLTLNNLGIKGSTGTGTTAQCW